MVKRMRNACQSLSAEAILRATDVFQYGREDVFRKVVANSNIYAMYAKTLLLFFVQ